MRAGDVVLHGPTGETWVLAYADERRGQVSPCGWPECIAMLSDCRLLKAATDQEYVDMLREWAESSGGDSGHDHRRGECRRQLQALEQAAQEVP